MNFLSQAVHSNSKLDVINELLFCVAKAIKDFTAETTAKFVFEEVVCKLGTPKSMISDQGVNFKAKLFKKLCELCKIKTAHSSVYHPAGNGAVERMNKTLKQILTMYVDASTLIGMNICKRLFQRIIRVSIHRRSTRRMKRSLEEVQLRSQT